MRKWFRQIITTGIVAVGAAFWGCSDNDPDKIPTTPGGDTSSVGSFKIENGVITGTLLKDSVLAVSQNYGLSGFVIVDSGATLTIPAGTQFKSDGKSALIIMPGSKIIAKGTAAQPIIFTSKKATPGAGDWAGVVVFGKAPVSRPGGVQGFEADPSLQFGGADSTDSSGVLQYVRIEYAGWEVSTDKELNGLTLGGVGSRTVISYVHVHAAKDDAIEWFGGFVNGDHLVVTSYEDDGYDIDEGYQGTNQYLLNIQSAGSDRGIEAGSVAENANQITNATFQNMTLVANSTNEAIHIKNNVAMKVMNSVIIGQSTPRLIKVEGAVSFAQVNSGATSFSNVFYSGTFDSVVVATDAAAKAALTPMFTSVTEAVDSTFFAKDSQVIASGAGAFVGATDWTAGWTKPGAISFNPGEGEPGTTGNVLAKVLQGNIHQDSRMVADSVYELSGFVYVDSGATLTIDSGTTVKSIGKSALIVMPGAKIIAVGTATKPIVFTSKNPNPVSGDWAGVVIFGKAPVSRPGNVQGFEAEPSLKFGGMDSTDSSGVLRYVRIEYGGWEVATDKELNGLTLGGVGSRTDISYVQVHAAKDDAIEWFGGFVGTHHMVVTDYSDDGFDIDEGYQGMNEYMLNIQGEGSDRGIEAGSVAENPNQITNATFKNMTIVANGTNQAIHIKNNVALQVMNSVIVGKETPELVKVEGAVSLEQVTNGATKFTTTFYDGSFADIANASGNAAAQAALDTMFTQATNAINAQYVSTGAAVVAANAGAVIAGDIWYQGWTRPNSIPTYSTGTILPKVVQGTITGNARMSADSVYELKDFVYVDTNATLTIDPGTMVKSEGKSALIVLPGGKIFAIGTKDKPIVFTSKKANPVSGDWAGVVIFGKAPVSRPGNVQGFEAEPSLKFGGGDSTHNSGVLRYVRIEYAGWEVATDKELNGLTLGGVGSGTTLEYVHVHAGKDDAIEWFGGFVNGKYLIVTDYNDDGYDIDEGYQGTNEYLINIQGPGSDRGIEAGSVAENANQITNVTFKKMTLVVNSTNEAIHIKNNVALKVEDAVIIGQDATALVKVEGAVSLSQVVDGSTVFSDVFYDGSFQSIVDASGNAAALALLSPMVTQAVGALNSDLTPSDDAIVAANAGAVTTGDLWYTGWTTPNTITYTPVNAGQVLNKLVSGNITANARMSADSVYELSGFVFVDSGATLTIDPGTMVKSEGKSALIVMPGAKIMAVGTPDKPIVLTSKKATPASGDWAGLVIFGKAPVSRPGNIQGFEAEPTLKFGGNDTTDNSGVLRYVRVEYGGWEVATDKELNGLTLGGVGNKTTVDYVHVHGAKDDAIEWFGGFVNGSHLVVTDYSDDGYDIDEGYQGVNKYLINLQGAGSDRGIEAGSVAENPNQITKVTFENLTMRVNSTNEAIHVKNNVALMVKNAVIIGQNPTALIKVEGAVSLQQATDGGTAFTNTFFSGTFADTVDGSGNAVVKANLMGMLTGVDNPLDSTFAPVADTVKNTQAGAIVGTNLWYQGWTKAGTVK